MNFLLTYTKQKGMILQFSLIKMEWEGYRKGTGYAAVGVSKDTKMGEDIMFVCSEVGTFYICNLQTELILTI